MNRKFLRRLWKQLNAKSFAYERTAETMTAVRHPRHPLAPGQKQEYQTVPQLVKFQSFPTLLWSEFKREPIVPAVENKRQGKAETFSKKRIAKRGSGNSASKKTRR